MSFKNCINFLLRHLASHTFSTSSSMLIVRVDRTSHYSRLSLLEWTSILVIRNDSLLLVVPHIIRWFLLLNPMSLTLSCTVVALNFFFDRRQICHRKSALGLLIQEFNYKELYTRYWWQKLVIIMNWRVWFLISRNVWGVTSTHNFALGRFPSWFKTRFYSLSGALKISKMSNITSSRSSRPRDSSALGSNFLSVLTTTNSPGFGTIVSLDFPYSNFQNWCNLLSKCYPFLATYLVCSGTSRTFF